ncbi:MAG TPA: lanthionine synthetase C family protein [Terrimicrobium sp.]
MLVGNSAIAADEIASVEAVVRDIASRMADLRRVETALAIAPHQTAHPRSINWYPYSLAQGYAGLVVMFGYLDASFPGEGWDIVAHEHLERAVSGLSMAYENKRVPRAGLFSGLAGLAFAACYVSRNGSRYQRLLGRLDAAIVPQALELAFRVRRQTAGPVSDFDLVSGLSGLAAYLLCRRTQQEIAVALREVTRTLVELATAAPLPRWHTPAHLLTDEATRQLYPSGNLNCGLAHGIPGPLAALSLVCKAGVRVDGMPEAINRIASWLVDHRIDDEWGPNWPTAFPLSATSESGAELIEQSSRAPATSRTAWCYGSPGISRALWLAGETINNRSYQQLATEALLAVYRRPLPERRIDSPTFCHGVAGLLQITRRFHHDTCSPRFAEAAQPLIGQVLSSFEPDSILGVRNLEAGGRQIDQAGLLDGAPGVVLALLAANGGADPAWDRMFLLS